MCSEGLRHRGWGPPEAARGEGTAELVSPWASGCRVQTPNPGTLLSAGGPDDPSRGQAGDWGGRRSQRGVRSTAPWTMDSARHNTCPWMLGSTRSQPRDHPTRDAGSARAPRSALWGRGAVPHRSQQPILPSRLGDQECGRGASSASLTCRLRPAGERRGHAHSASPSLGEGAGDRGAESGRSPQKETKPVTQSGLHFQTRVSSEWGGGSERAQRPSPRLPPRLCPGSSPAGWAVAPCDPAPPPRSFLLGQPWLSPSPQQDARRSARYRGLSLMEWTRAEPVRTAPGPALGLLCAGPEAALSPGPCGPPSPGTSAAHPPPWELKGGRARVTAQRCLPRPQSISARPPLGARHVPAKRQEPRPQTSFTPPELRVTSPHPRELPRGARWVRFFTPSPSDTLFPCYTTLSCKIFFCKTISRWP